MKKTIRVIVGIVCFSIILIVAIWMIQNRDTVFQNKATITYPDRCIEEYIDNELVSEECTNGRNIMEEERNKADKLYEEKLAWQNLNLTS